MGHKIPKPSPQFGAPVCIAGMHRSGTSTVAQLLYRCGLYLGPEQALFSAREVNPDGFWENRRFVAINERILEAYGAGWDLPPAWKRGWHLDARLQGLREDAQRLTSSLKGQSRWGWKDPRNSLTLPFWQTMLPEIKMIVCLRNPLEVALSLRKRANSSFALGFNLWRIYHERLLDELSEGQYLVTHYDAYFLRPLRELRRMLNFLELPASDQRVAHARSSSLKNMRHYSATIQELRDAGASEDLIELYLSFCQLATRDIDDHHGYHDMASPVSGTLGNPV
jgi:hypothetical protein